jgi:hypothetical protein
MSPSVLVELTEMTFVRMAGREVGLDVLVPPGELLEQPAHTAAATATRAIQPVCTDGP